MKFLYIRFIKKHIPQFVIVCILAIVIPIISNIVPRLSQYLLDGVLVPNNTKTIVLLVLAIILLYVTKYLLSAMTQANVTKINLSAISDMKKEIINDVINLPIVFHDSNSNQYVLSRINEVDYLSNLFSSDLINFVIGAISAITSLIIIVSVSPTITICTMFSLPILFVITKRAFSKMHTQINDLMEVSARTHEGIYSNISGVVTLKQFNSENDAIKKIGTQIDVLTAKTKAKSLSISNNSNLIIGLVFVVQNILVGVVAILINENSLSIGHFLSISQYLALVYVPILSYQSISINIKPAIIAYKRINELYVKPSKNKIQNKIESIDKLTIQNLSFHYPNKSNILENINLTLTRGDKLLLYGANGSGKTTLSKILLGFYDDYEGSIFIDSIELREIDHSSLRDKVSIVPQDIFLFNASIEENIRIANKSLSDREFEEKIQYFNSVGLIDGIDIKQMLQDNGKNLSGGQIQRIALARLLLRETDVCIFDEFTNSLDSTVRNAIEVIIEQAFNEKICIFITHDNYLVDMCNVNLSLGKGVKI